MILRAVFNGGGRPGRFALDFKDAIVPLGSTPLCAAMAQHGSDKGDGWHTYTPFYHFMLQHRRSETRRVLEIGIGSPRTMPRPGYVTGASLRAWRTYFPSATVIGADIDVDAVEEATLAGFPAYKVDQKSSHSVAWLWKRIIRDHQEQPFDLIVDDGLHTADAGITTLLGSQHMIGNLYVVEDVKPKDADQWRAVLSHHKSLRGVLVQFDGATTTEDDNCLIVIERV